MVRTVFSCSTHGQVVFNRTILFQKLVPCFFLCCKTLGRNGDMWVSTKSVAHEQHTHDTSFYICVPCLASFVFAEFDPCVFLQLSSCRNGLVQFVSYCAFHVNIVSREEGAHTKGRVVGSCRVRMCPNGRRQMGSRFVWNAVSLIVIDDWRNGVPDNSWSIRVFVDGASFHDSLDLISSAGRQDESNVAKTILTVQDKMSRHFYHLMNRVLPWTMTHLLRAPRAPRWRLVLSHRVFLASGTRARRVWQSSRSRHSLMPWRTGDSRKLVLSV